MFSMQFNQKLLYKHFFDYSDFCLHYRIFRLTFVRKIINLGTTE